MLARFWCRRGQVEWLPVVPLLNDLVWADGLTLPKPEASKLGLKNSGASSMRGYSWNCHSRPLRRVVRGEGGLGAGLDV
jgi:hypothetical protein